MPALSPSRFTLLVDAKDTRSAEDLLQRPLDSTDALTRVRPASSTPGREQRPYGCERAEFTLPRRGAAVAATNSISAGARCNRRVTLRVREFGARGWAVRCRQGRDERAQGGGEAPLCSIRPTAGGGRM
jgi:hypothetical protein